MYVQFFAIIYLCSFQKFAGYPIPDLFNFIRVVIEYCVYEVYR